MRTTLPINHVDTELSWRAGFGCHSPRRIGLSPAYPVSSRSSRLAVTDELSPASQLPDGNSKIVVFTPYLNCVTKTTEDS